MKTIKRFFLMLTAPSRPQRPGIQFALAYQAAIEAHYSK